MTTTRQANGIDLSCRVFGEESSMPKLVGPLLKQTISEWSLKARGKYPVMGPRRSTRNADRTRRGSVPKWLRRSSKAEANFCRIYFE